MNFNINSKNKKKYKLNRELWIIFCIIFSIFLKCNFTYADATTTDQLNAQIQKITDNKAQLQKEIDAYTQQLKDLGVQSTSLSNTIKSLDATINKNALNIRLTQSNIDATELEIKLLSIDIGKNTDIINQDGVAIANLIKEINDIDNNTIIENIITYKDLSELWNNIEQIASIQSSIRGKVLETKDTKTKLEGNKTVEEQKKAELLKYKSSLVDQENLLSITKGEKNKLLAATKNSETAYKKMLANKQALADSFDKELAEFQSELTLTINSSSYPAPKHGILDWPLTSIKVTQLFGNTAFSKTTTAYNGNGHNGLDLAAPIGTPTYAALSGIVAGTGDTDTVCPGASFGKWVFLQYPNGLSTIYAHLSLIKVKAGDHVSVGDIIGYTGLTGFTTGPHLHFGLYVTQGSEITSYKSKVCKGTYTMPVADLKAYLDPLQYLPSL
jgi:murein DD-endopeptidase MepM/ murein hydrolase activator NlpD